MSDWERLAEARDRLADNLHAQLRRTFTPLLGRLLPYAERVAPYVPGWLNLRLLYWCIAVTYGAIALACLWALRA